MLTGLRPDALQQVVLRYLPQQSQNPCVQSSKSTYLRASVAAVVVVIWSLRTTADHVPIAILSRLWRESAFGKNGWPMRASIAKHISQGRCGQGCGRELATKTRCRPCLEKVRDLQRLYNKHGLCQNGCSRELATKTRCRICADKMLRNPTRLVSNAS